MRAHRPSSRALYWPCIIALASFLACDGDDDGDDDYYECGIRVGSEVAICDGENQVCVCGVRRCAEYDPVECGDGGTAYRYVFGDQKCVPEDHDEFRLPNSASPDTALCPEVTDRPQPAARCGSLPRTSAEPSPCSEGTTCVCTAEGGVCATPLASCRETGYATAGRCLTLSSTGFVQPVADGELCPGAAKPTPCGATDAAGRLQTCAGGEMCVCDGASGGCAEPVDDAVCSGGLRYRKPDGFRQCVSATLREVVERGVCPGGQPPPIACGTLDETTGALGSCRAEETCMCKGPIGQAPVTGTCTRREPNCGSGYAYVHDGACVQLDANAFTVALDAASMLCPAAPPTSRKCGGDIAMECAGAAGCWCNGEPRCVITSNGCSSGFALEGSMRCVPLADAAEIAASGTCEAVDGGVAP